MTLLGPGAPLRLADCVRVCLQLEQLIIDSEVVTRRRRITLRSDASAWHAPRSGSGPVTPGPGPQIR